VSRSGPRGGLAGNRDYLRLWGAQGISAFGSHITLVALPLVAILTLEASPFEVAALTALELLPFLLLGIPAGVWVDRLRRRPVLVLTDFARAASLLSIPLAYGLGALTLPHLYAVALVNGALTVFFTLAYQAYLPTLVERADLVRANARFEATETVARLAGPASGGGLVGLLSAPVAILADAVSFVVSGALILRIRDREPPAERAARPARSRGAFRSELREGARFALRDDYVRPILATTAVLNVGFGMVWAVLLVYAVRDLGLGAGVLGLTLSAGEVGGLLGAVAVGRVTTSIGPGPVVVAAPLLFGPAFLAIAIAPSSMPFPSLVIGWAVVSFASVVFNATTVGVRQSRVPLRLQGRVVGVSRTIVWGVTPLGALLGGALGSAVGMRETIVAGAAVALAAVVPAVLSPLRSLRSLPDAAAPDPARF
jgi:MFS family permease